MLVTLLLLVTTNTWASDYDPQSREWNGSSYLLETAREARVSLQLADEVDWATVDPDTVLVLVSPSLPPDVDSLLAFLRDGGHAVVLDDFGASDPLLDRVGIHKVPGVLRHDDFLDDDPSFPVLQPGEEHFLFFNIRGVGGRIVGNHPTSFELSDGATAILRYAGGAAFIAEARVGRGALLAVADGSVFINEMLHQHGDKQLAANLLRYYCTGQSCEVTLATPSTRWVGRYDPRSARDRSTLDGLFLESVSIIDAFVSRASGSLGEGPRLRALLLLTLAVLGLATLRLGRRAAVHDPVPAVPAEVPAASEIVAAGMAGARHRADFRGAAASIAATVRAALRRQRLGPASDAAADLERAARTLAGRVHPRDPQARDALRRKVLNLLPLSVSVPAAAGPPRPVSASEFEALDDDARHILGAIAGLRGRGDAPPGQAPPAGGGGAGAGPARPDDRGDQEGLHR
ncbi:MAG: hypothetical protein AMXMBFR64_46640 [Myxococcales bacterium]